MSELSAYQCTPKQAERFVIECITSGLVPFLRGSPGVGKSALIRAVAKAYNLKVIDLRLSQATPEDLQGLPRFRDIVEPGPEGQEPISRTIAEFVPFDVFPLEGTPVPPGYDGWLLFLDEMNSAIRPVQAACYKLILDRMVGQAHLHPHVAIVAAGNLDTDRAIVNSLSTAMQSRLVNLVIKLDRDEFLQTVAFPQAWDPRITAFLSFKEGALHDFQPDHDNHTFCCPRTWEFMNKLVKGKQISEDMAPLYAGTITAGVAVEFITFTKVFNDLPKLQDILARPDGTPIPSDAATRFALITHLVEQVDDERFDAIATYINRLTSELRVLFFRALMVRQPGLRKHAAFRKALLELSKYLHDDDTDTAGAAAQPQLSAA